MLDLRGQVCRVAEANVVQHCRNALTRYTVSVCYEKYWSVWRKIHGREGECRRTLGCGMRVDWFGLRKEDGMEWVKRKE